MRDTTEYINAEKTALRLIARAEQCGAGLARKLEKRGFDPVCVSGVIERLFELNLLDDRRYASAWLRSRLQFTRSPRRLLSSLCAKGIDSADAKAAIKETLNSEAEFSLLTRYAQKTKKKAACKENGNSARGMKFILKNEGFSAETIQRFLDEE